MANPTNTILKTTGSLWQPQTFVQTSMIICISSLARPLETCLLHQLAFDSVLTLLAIRSSAVQLKAETMGRCMGL